MKSNKAKLREASKKAQRTRKSMQRSRQLDLIFAGNDAPAGIEHGNNVAVAVAFFATPRAFKVGSRRFGARSGVWEPSTRQS